MNTLFVFYMEMSLCVLTLCMRLGPLGILWGPGTADFFICKAEARQAQM